MNEAELEAGLAETPRYRYAERVGKQLFVAGQVPHDSEGQFGPRGPAGAAMPEQSENAAVRPRLPRVSDSSNRRLRYRQP